MQTLEEYKRAGGFCAFVPGDITHIETRVKTRRFRTPPSREWPDGREVEITGSETLLTEVVEGRRVVRFTSLHDWHDLRTLPGDHTLQWESMNPELCQLYVSLTSAPKGAGPIQR